MHYKYVIRSLYAKKFVVSKSILLKLETKDDALGFIFSRLEHFHIYCLTCWTKKGKHCFG